MISVLLSNSYGILTINPRIISNFNSGWGGGEMYVIIFYTACGKTERPD